MANKKITALVFYLVAAAATVAQVSLWKDHNPFSEEIKAGDLVKLVVDEYFDISIKSSWNNSHKLEMKLYPDNKNFSFLQNSEQSRKSARKSEVNYKIKESLEFELMAQVSDNGGSNNNTFTITGEKSLLVDDKPIQLRVTGLAHKNSIFKGQIKSNDLANFSMTIVAKAPLAKENVTGNVNASNNDNLTDAEKRDLILRHIQEILGYFKQ